jgi:hypothetical protein
VSSFPASCLDRQAQIEGARSCFISSRRLELFVGALY